MCGEPRQGAKLTELTRSVARHSGRSTVESGWSGSSCSLNGQPSQSPPRIPAAPTGTDGALRDRRAAITQALRRPRGARCLATCVRHPGVPGLPALRPARIRLHPRQVQRLPSRALGSVFVQTARLLSVLRCQAHDRDLGAPHRSRHSSRTGAPVGAELPLAATHALREPPAGAEPLPGSDHPCHPDRPGTARGPESHRWRTDRDRHTHPALWKCPEPECLRGPVICTCWCWTVSTPGSTASRASIASPRRTGNA